MINSTNARNMVKGEILCCPECGQGVRVTNGKILRHEKGLAYVPYGLYKRIEKISGTSVKEQAKGNLCSASGQIHKHKNKDIKQ